MVTEQWEQREDGAGYNKPWEIYFEAAEQIANIAFSSGAAPNQVPTLVRDYFRALAGDVRNDMATRSVNSASARTSVAARACRQALQTKDVVKVEAYRAAASLLKEAGDTWVTAPSATLSAVYLSGQTIWSDIVKKAQAAATSAFDNRAQPGEISDLFGGFLNRFMVVARTRRKVEGLPWGATKKIVAGVMLRGYISTDPVKAAAYTAAALMLEAVPSGDIAEFPVSPPAGSEPRQAAAPAAAAAAAAAAAETAAAELSPKVGSNAPSACVNTLSTPPTASTPTSGTRDTVASMAKGCDPSLSTEAASSDHASTSPPVSEEQNPNTTTTININNNNNTLLASAATMSSLTGVIRTRWTKQWYSRSGSVNNPTLVAQPTTSSEFPRCMDTVKTRSSSSDRHDVPEDASIVPGAAPAVAVEAVGVASGVTATPAPFSADQGTGAVGCSSSGQPASKDATETKAEEGIDGPNVVDILAPAAPEAVVGEGLDVGCGIYMPSPDASGPGDSVFPMVEGSNTETGEKKKAAGDGGGGGNSPCDEEERKKARSECPVVEGSITETGETRKAAGDGGGGENSPCDERERKKARSECPVVEGSNAETGEKRKAAGDGGGGGNSPCDERERKKARSECPVVEGSNAETGEKRKAAGDGGGGGNSPCDERERKKARSECPVVEGSNAGTGEKRKAAGDEGGGGNSPCDERERKKARSECPVVEGSNAGAGEKRKAAVNEGGGENSPCDEGERKKARSE
eukprot:jgi/Undpi1/10229/HiC_scaffold_28.g12682.m1